MSEPMTNERLAEIRNEILSSYINPRDETIRVYQDTAIDLLAEIERLRAEVTELNYLRLGGDEERGLR